MLQIRLQNLKRITLTIIIIAFHECLKLECWRYSFFAIRPSWLSGEISSSTPSDTGELKPALLQVTGNESSTSKARELAETVDIWCWLRWLACWHLRASGQTVSRSRRSLSVQSFDAPRNEIWSTKMAVVSCFHKTGLRRHGWIFTPFRKRKSLKINVLLQLRFPPLLLRISHHWVRVPRKLCARFLFQNA